MFSCLGYDDNKALSHKITKGGSMRVGDMVIMRRDPQRRLGIIIDKGNKYCNRTFKVSWFCAKWGESICSRWFLEVLCE